MQIDYETYPSYVRETDPGPLAVFLAPTTTEESPGVSWPTWSSAETNRDIRCSNDGDCAPTEATAPSRVFAGRMAYPNGGLRQGQAPHRPRAGAERQNGGFRRP